MNASRMWPVSVVFYLAAHPIAIADHPLSPTPVYLLPHAAMVMQAYHDRHGEYPREWRLLDFEYNSDRPKQQNKELYQQPNGDFVYKIVSADKHHFHIQALGWEDQPAYEIRDGLKDAIELPGAAIKLPRLRPDVPEPKDFLPVAAAAMKAYHDANRTYPTSWGSLKITYSAIPYHPYTLNIRPKVGESSRWQPRGCEYVYEIVPQHGDHFLIQAQKRRQKFEYEIRDGNTESKVIGEAGPVADRGGR